MAKRKLTKKTLRVAQIRALDKGPRWIREYDEEKLADLKDSIADQGQIHDVVVRPSKKSKATYELIAGGRRFRAIKELGLETIDVKIADVDDEEARLFALAENLMVERPSSSEWAAHAEEWRKKTNIRRGYEPDAKSAGGKPKKKRSDSKPRSRNLTQKNEVTEDEEGLPPVSVKEMAKKFGVSTSTVARAQKRERNLTASSKAAWRLGKLTDAQVDELAATPKDRQEAVLREMLSHVATKQQEAAVENKAELDAAKSRVEMKKRLRACEDLCRRELVPELIDLVGAAKDDDLLVSRLSSVPTIKITEARDLIDELLDILGS